MMLRRALALLFALVGVSSTSAVAQPSDPLPSWHEGATKARIDRAFVLVPAQTYVGNWLQSVQDFAPRQKPGSLNLDRLMSPL